jgi:cytochrome P450
VAPALNERITELVWKESLGQARDMMETLSEPSSTGQSKESNEILEGLKRITMNVIGFVGYGTQRHWAEAATTAPPPAFKTTFMSSIATIADNFVQAVFIPANYLMLPFMPKAVKHIGISKTEFPLHLRKSIAAEQALSTKSNNLIGSLVRLAEKDKGRASGSSKASTYLTEEEIMGNLFAFTIAGYETTSTTLAYAVLMLAIDPKWQDWIVHEIDKVTGLHPEADYASIFPLLTRCSALMVRFVYTFT